MDCCRYLSSSLPKYLRVISNFELVARKTRLRDNYIPLLSIIKYILAKVKSRHASQVFLFIAHRLPEFKCKEVITTIISRVHTIHDLFRLCNVINKVYVQDTVIYKCILSVIETRLLWIIDMCIHRSFMWTDALEVNMVVGYIKCSGIPFEKPVSRILHNVLLNMCVKAGRFGNNVFEYIVCNMVNIVDYLLELQVLTMSNVIEALQFRFTDISRRHGEQVYYDYYKFYRNNSINVIGIFMSCIGDSKLMNVDLAEHIMCHIKYKSFGDYINKAGIPVNVLSTITKEDKYLTFEQFLIYLCETSQFDKLKKCIIYASITFDSTPKFYLVLLNNIGMNKYVTQECIEMLVYVIYFTNLELRPMREFNFSNAMNYYKYFIKIMLLIPNMERFCNVRTIAFILNHIQINTYIFCNFELARSREYDTILLYVLNFVDTLVSITNQYFSEEIRNAISTMISKTEFHAVAYIKAMREYKFLADTVIEGIIRRPKFLDGMWLRPMARVLNYAPPHVNKLLNAFRARDVIKYLSTCEHLASNIDDKGLYVVVTSASREKLSADLILAILKFTLIRFPEKLKWVCEECKYI